MLLGAAKDAWQETNLVSFLSATLSIGDDCPVVQ
jgi:hypothetical protein